MLKIAALINKNEYAINKSVIFFKMNTGKELKRLDSFLIIVISVGVKIRQKQKQ
jgi:hypothetical protein